MADRLQDKVIEYYQTRESRLGYRWLLGGTKHFGYYPAGRHVSMRQAMRLMEGKLKAALALPNNSRILDAGCGMGRVAVHLAADTNYQIDGIDLLDFNIYEAKRYAKRHRVNRVSFQIGDYTSLPFADNSFDGIYTMETLYHAPDYIEALQELRRVLKPTANW